jgi:hypothetical protein
LNTASHSAGRSRSGPEGARPALVAASVAVAKGEAAEPGLRLAFPAASEQAHRRADAAGEDETGAESTRRDDRQLRAELGADVGRLRAERVDRAGELLARGRDIQLDLLQVAAVTGPFTSKPPS